MYVGYYMHQLVWSLIMTKQCLVTAGTAAVLGFQQQLLLKMEFYFWDAKLVHRGFI